MRLLARRVDRPKDWTLLGDGNIRDTEFPAAVIADLCPKGYLSVWEVDVSLEEDVARLVAALYANSATQQLNDTVLKFADEASVVACGIKVIKKGGTSLDEEFNVRHRDLVIETSIDAINLARIMLRFPERNFRVSDVEDMIGRSIKCGYFNLGSLGRDVVKKLAQNGKLSFL